MELNDWLKKWEEDNPKLAEWKKQQFYSYPQKFVVGLSDSDGNLTDIGVTDPGEFVEVGESEPLKLEMETITAKKPFDYVEQYSGGKGGFLHQQLSSTWTSSTNDAEHLKAFQEMLWKVGHYQTAPVWDEMKNQMPELNQMVRCPGHSSECWWASSVWNMVQHLNDSHRWSREAIADWLEESGNNPEFPTPEDVPKEPGEK